MTWANRILFVVNIALALLVVVFLAARGVAHVDSPFSPSDIVVILLTTALVILAALTIFLAVMAVLGINWVRNEIRRAVRDSLVTTKTEAVETAEEFEEEEEDEDEDDNKGSG